MLAAGDFAGGWPEYEWRLKRVARHQSLPTWDGRDLDGKRIVLYAEGGQGFGDTLQFVRYAPLVRQRGGDVVLEVQPTLVKLLAESGFNHVVAEETPLVPPCDFQAAMMSLPRILGTDLASIPAPVPYLRAQAEAVAAWGEKLAQYAGLKIGIHWHGSRIAVDNGRVIPLHEFEVLARLPGIHLFSMQMGSAAAELSNIAQDWPLMDLSPALHDFHDSAAITSNFDLVITSDSALAHLAGALGTPVWVALPYSAEWRWLTDRDDSPWYPTMRLFRQAHVNEWSGAFSRMASELTRLVAHHQNA